jgi:hypothetical protein
MEPVSSGQNECYKVISPFAQSETAVSPKGRSKTKLWLIISLGVLLVVGGAAGGMLMMRYLNNPYRTLQPFPVQKYLDGYEGLAGSKFKAESRVEADLGWKDKAGRLMLFSTADDPRPVAVFVPAAVAKDIYFTKGQVYTTEIEVKEGGLIYASSFEKD